MTDGKGQKTTCTYDGVGRLNKATTTDTAGTVTSELALPHRRSRLGGGAAATGTAAGTGVYPVAVFGAVYTGFAVYRYGKALEDVEESC